MTQEHLHYPACPVCSSGIRPWRAKRVGSITYNLDLCDQCGYCFVNPRPSLQFLINYYAGGHAHVEGAGEANDLQSALGMEERDPNSTIDARRIIKTVKALSTPGVSKRFLDVGCGYGFFSREALAGGFDVLALELAANERQIAKEMTGVVPSDSSFEEFECERESLGVILMSQILEHALDVDSWISRSRDLLVPNGILAVALPNFGSLLRHVMQENEPYICPPAHLNFFNPRSLSRLLEKHGFKIEEIQWVSRIPRSAIERRVPAFGRRALMPAIQAATSASLKIMDTLRLGMMINVYGRKIASRE